ARGGFVELIQRRLTDIYVRSGTTTLSLVRQYHFDYQTNLTETSQKSVLSAVSLRGVENQASSELYRHTFEYNKAPAIVGSQYPMFSSPQTWGQVFQPSPTGNVPRSADGLGHSSDELIGGAITLGIGFP